MKQCAFTICAKNYIGLAQVLERSFRACNPGRDFYIFVADLPDRHTPALEPNVWIARDKLGLDGREWTELSFKYDLTEFCTAIKPLCFEYLFDAEGYGSATYLDPDIYCFSSFDPVYARLESHSIVLSPHILTIEERYGGDLWENLFLWAGSYNLGFLALRNSGPARKLLRWWAGVLRDECFVDNRRFTATDQKWMVFAPMFFDASELHIDRDMGIDAAPWNFYEREFFEREGRVWVRNRIDPAVEPTPLMFVHYSNYKYSELLRGVVKHYNLKREYADLPLVFDPYVAALRQGRMADFLPLEYSYNTFDDGTTISPLNRRIYRRLLVEGEAPDNPFATVRGGFYDTLRKRKLLTRRNAVTTTVRGADAAPGGATRLLRVFDLGCQLLKGLMGVDRYERFIRFASSRLAPENQTCLYDRKSRPNL